MSVYYDTVKDLINSNNSVPDVMEKQALRRTALVPIRVEFETETHRIRDCFIWNINETIITPENFAKIFCTDLDLPLAPWADTVANQIRAQLEEQEGVASMEIGLDGALDLDTLPPNGEDMHECRVILSVCNFSFFRYTSQSSCFIPQIDVQIANYHLMDHIEWDLLSPLTPEDFSLKLCVELGLSGEAIPLVAHAIHEELMKHKKDAIEWGVIGGDLGMGDDTTAGAGGGEKPAKAGWGVVKDKTGLGLNWGRAPKDGRGPKTLKSVWRDWAEAEEFRTKFEELTAEEVERREVERERASRYVILLDERNGELTYRAGDCVERLPSFRRHGLGGDSSCSFTGWLTFVTYHIYHTVTATFSWANGHRDKIA